LLQHETVSLRKDNRKLALQLKRLQELERNLELAFRLQHDQGRNPASLMKRVDAYRRGQEKIQASLQAKIIQHLVQAMKRSDHEIDFMIDKNHTDGLLWRFQGMRGVQFSLGNFRKAIGKNVNDVLQKQGGFDLQTVLIVIKNLMDDTLPAEEAIFQIQPECMLPRQVQI